MARGWRMVLGWILQQLSFARTGGVFANSSSVVCALVTSLRRRNRTRRRPFSRRARSLFIAPAQCELLEVRQLLSGESLTISSLVIQQAAEEESADASSQPADSLAPPVLSVDDTETGQSEFSEPGLTIPEVPSVGGPNTASVGRTVDVPSPSAGTDSSLSWTEGPQLPPALVDQVIVELTENDSLNSTGAGSDSASGSPVNPGTSAAQTLVTAGSPAAVLFAPSSGATMHQAWILAAEIGDVRVDCPVATQLPAGSPLARNIPGDDGSCLPSAADLSTESAAEETRSNRELLQGVIESPSWRPLSWTAMELRSPVIASLVGQSLVNPDPWLEHMFGVAAGDFSSDLRGQSVRVSSVPREAPLASNTQFRPSAEYSARLTQISVRRLRENHRHASGTEMPELTASANEEPLDQQGTDSFPRELKYVLNPRAPPDGPHESEVRIVGQDASADLLRRLRYSIAPRGPSLVIAVMQLPEFPSFSGPRVSPDCSQKTLVC